MRTLDRLQVILHPLNRKNLSQEEHACQPAKKRRQDCDVHVPVEGEPSVQFRKTLGSIFHRRTAGGAPKIAKGRISETGILPFFLKISTQRIQLRERQPLTTEKYLQPGAVF
jgi:hypothetical protein